MSLIPLLVFNCYHYILFLVLLSDPLLSIVFFHCIYVLYLLFFYGYNSVFITYDDIAFLMCIH
jgi:hypothetical protein